ncbi:MAG: alpha-amylase family glycosyl hydrolase [Thermoleophilaceae bacterium]
MSVPPRREPLRWWQRGAIYQIYPRSFQDSNGDGVGDLPGITSRLDYIASLGVEAIWLSPFYLSPMADFGYDVSDYTDVDPLFGTLADFDTMLAEAHARGVRVVVDWVPNHSSDQHPWFAESRSGRDNPKRDWYVWRDAPPGGGPPNNWRSAFVDRAWTLDEASGQYYLHSFLPQQPELNWDNPEVEGAMHDVLRFWLDRGVDGFRIDVVHKLGKDPELGDNEPGRLHDQDWPSVHERLRRIRAVVDEYEDRMIVGEVYLRDLERVVPYVKTGDELNLAHNFVFVHLPWDAQAMRESVDEFERLSEDAAWPTWLLANHDHSRVATRYAGSDPGSGERRSRLATLMTCTLRGTPFVFEGEELGLPDAEVPPERIVDVGGRDPERAPIPWERPSRAGPGAGFTSGHPWLPLVADAERLSVEAQEEDPHSTLQFVRRLVLARADSEVLQAGSQRSLDAGRDVFAFERELFGARMLVALNFSSRRQPAGLPGGRGELLLSTHSERRLEQVDTGKIVLEPDEGVVVRSGA